MTNYKEQKRAYVVPKIKVVGIESDNLLLDTSFPGQHNPALPGTPPSAPSEGAKRDFFEVDDEEENYTPQSRALWD